MSETQNHLVEEVSSRLSKATEELREKYDTGMGGTDGSFDQPTGSAYRERNAAIQRERLAKKKMEKESSSEAPSSSPGDDEDSDPDEDADLRFLREKRLKELKKSQSEKIENIAKGHGELREIEQDQFLKEVTSSLKVVCHFYHSDFPRCAIMDHHLQRIAARHIETKFVKINAAKAPFFVDKLKIRTMPTLVFFTDGVANEKLIGFEHLTDGLEEGKEDEWPTVRLARYMGSIGFIRNDLIVDEEGVEQAAKAKLEEMRRNVFSSNIEFDSDEDFDD